MLSRRQLVGKLAAGTAGAAVAWAAIPQSARGATSPAEVNVGKPVAGTEVLPSMDAEAPAPWALIRPLVVGSPIGHGWSVADLTAVADGSCVLTMRNERGREQRVHLCRNDGNPQGLAHSERFDLVVMNGGRGDLPTEEGLAQAIAALAGVLAANEDGQQHRQLAMALLPHAERVRSFEGSLDRKLR